MKCRLSLMLLATAASALTFGPEGITPQGQSGIPNGFFQSYLSRLLCSFTTCDLTTFCQLGKCWPKLPTSAVCGNDLVCISGRCQNGRCAAPIGGILGSLAGLNPIVLRLSQLLTTVAPTNGTGGGGTTTTSTTTTTTTTPTTCMSAPICETTTTFCDPTDGMCKPMGAVGDTCASNDQCRTRLCLNTLVCGCSRDSDCPLGETCMNMMCVVVMP